MPRFNALFVIIASLLVPSVPIMAQSQDRDTKIVRRPAADTCATIAAENLREATAGFATMPTEMAKQRFNRAQIRLRRNANVRAMLVCLMDRTK